MLANDRPNQSEREKNKGISFSTNQSTRKIDVISFALKRKHFVPVTSQIWYEKKEHAHTKFDP